MTQRPHELVWTLTTAGFAARCVHVIADLGVADRIDDSRASADELVHRDGKFGHTASSGCCAVTTR